MRRGCAAFVLLLLAGCTQQRGHVGDAFPNAGTASPWHLQGIVWTGDFDAAATALGDAERWRPFAPTHVWIAKYRHETQPRRTLTARAVACDTVAHAHAAYVAFAPADATIFQAGDEGCWTDIGVLFRWGRLVFDIFPDQAGGTGELQAGLIASLIVERMPADVPANPQ